MNSNDIELLRRYVFERSESAFADLVQQHIALVYSAALRQTNGDAPLAEDITQVVFTDLARKAARLTRHTSLAGWLYTSTRYAAQRGNHAAFPPLVYDGVERFLRGLGRMIIERDGGQRSGTHGGDPRVGGLDDAFGEAGSQVAALGLAEQVLAPIEDQCLLVLFGG